MEFCFLKYFPYTSILEIFVLILKKSLSQFNFHFKFHFFFFCINYRELLCVYETASLCSPVLFALEAGRLVAGSKCFFTHPLLPPGSPPRSRSARCPRCRYRRGVAGARWSPPAALRSAAASPELPPLHPALLVATHRARPGKTGRGSRPCPVEPRESRGLYLWQPKGFKEKVKFGLIETRATY